MIVLAVDTSTLRLCAGLVEFTSESVLVRAERFATGARGHAELLTPLIVETLAESGISRSEIEAVVVGCGPGPFTGLRVGMATGAAFADALGIPAYPVVSLDAIAGQLGPGADRVIVATDARRREIYYAGYESAVRSDGPAVAKPSDVIAALDGSWAVAGPGAELLLGAVPAADRDRFAPVTGDPIAGPTPAALVRAAAAALLAGTPAPLVPLYLRRPDAVEPSKPAGVAPTGPAGSGAS